MTTTLKTAAAATRMMGYEIILAKGLAILPYSFMTPHSYGLLMAEDTTVSAMTKDTSRDRGPGPGLCPGSWSPAFLPLSPLLRAHRCSSVWPLDSPGQQKIATYSCSIASYSYNIAIL